MKLIEKQMTIAELSRQTGISRVTLSRIERGSRLATVHTIGFEEAQVNRCPVEIELEEEKNEYRLGDPAGSVRPSR